MNVLQRMHLSFSIENLAKAKADGGRMAIDVKMSATVTGYSLLEGMTEFQRRFSGIIGCVEATKI